MTKTNTDFPLRDYAHVRAELLAGREIALLDVREEDPHAQAHPLFAANFPYGRIELDAWTRLPRRDVAIVVLDDGEGLALPAAARLRQLGYTDVSLLDGGVSGWAAAGGELFRDVNVPSKSFGELVESERHTPSLSAQQVQALIDAKENIVILDARRFDEYQTMNIPGSISVPGAELALRVRELAPTLPLLIPGIGAQGGDIDATVKAGWRENGPIIVSSSRAILYAGSGDDFAGAARQVALATRAALKAATRAAA